MSKYISLKRNIPTIYYIVFVAVVLGSLFLWQMSVAQTDTVAATVTATDLSVSLTGGSISFGSMNLSASSSTGSGNGYTQTATNDGSIMQLNVKTLDTASWTVGTSPSSEVYKLEVSTTSGSSWMTFQSDNTYLTASTSMPAANTETLDFKFWTPTATSDFAQQTMTITVQAASI